MKSFSPPSVRNLERLNSWGLATRTYSHVYRPENIEEIKKVLILARESGKSVALRGGGCSYGDASLNDEAIVMDLTRMNRILAWDRRSGVIEVEPGVTVQQLWEFTLEDGFWPPVVSGTMFPTLGGICAMNIHGKNNFRVGPIGNHVLEFDLLLPDGTLKKCSPQSESALFHAAIGGLGMLGIFTRIKLQMKKIYSGYLWVEPLVARNLTEMFDLFEARLPRADYLVGWVDCLSQGRILGRGVIHQANYLAEGVDPHAKESLRVSEQNLPDKIMGVFPKSLMWFFMRPFVNNPGMALINAAKYWSAVMSLRGHKVLQAHAAFNFLLDYVPNWKWAYRGRGGEGGLIQYQPFVPKEHAREVFRELIQRAQERSQPPYLGVMKRHKPDNFLLTHAVDGYSLALDFKVTAWNRERLWKMTEDFDRLVLDAGGRFYFAKDSTLNGERAAAYLGTEVVEKFRALKFSCDPEGLLQSDLTRRIFAFEKPRAEVQAPLKKPRLRIS